MSVTGVRDHRWTGSSTLFAAAGALFLTQVLLIGLRRFGVSSFSELWIAPFGIAAVIVSLVALIALYPRLSYQAPRMARSGVAAAMCAGVLLAAAAVWLVFSSAKGGAPNPLPSGLLGLIGAFMIAFSLGFVLTAVASLASGFRTIGYLLLVPVVSWATILIVAFTTNMGDALRLDIYTNGAIGIAFIALGLLLQKTNGQKWE